MEGEGAYFHGESSVLAVRIPQLQSWHCHSPLYNIEQLFSRVVLDQKHQQLTNWNSLEIHIFRAPPRPTDEGILEEGSSKVFEQTLQMILMHSEG